MPEDESGSKTAWNCYCPNGLAGLSPQNNDFKNFGCISFDFTFSMLFSKFKWKMIILGQKMNKNFCFVIGMIAVFT